MRLPRVTWLPVEEPHLNPSLMTAISCCCIGWRTGESIECGCERSWVRVTALPFPGDVTLDKHLNFTEPHFLHP